MSRFKVVVIKHGPPAPNVDKGDDDKTEKTNYCFLCSKAITELQSATINRLNNSKKLVQTFIELLTGEELCSTESEVLLTELQGNNSSSFHCCSTCRISLIFWHDLTNTIKTLTVKTSRIKSTVVANILTSSRISTTTDSGASSSSALLQKLHKIKKKVIDEYSPKVVLVDLQQQQSQLPPAPVSFASLPTAVEIESNEDDDLEGAADPGFDLDLEDEMAGCLDDERDDETIHHLRPDFEATTEVEFDEDYNEETADLDVDLSQDEIADTIDERNETIDLLDRDSEAFTTELINSAESDDADSEVAVKSEDVSETVRPESTNLKVRKKRKQEFLKTSATMDAEIEIIDPTETVVVAAAANNDSETLQYYRKYPVIFNPSENDYSCGSCESRFEKRVGVVIHIRMCHFTDQDKQELTAVKTERINSGKDLTYKGIGYSFDPVQLKYKCSLCPSSFNARDSIRSHIQYIHLGIAKRFSCDVCGMLVKTKRSRERHKLRAHGGAPTFICQYCGKVFKNKYTFDGHVDVHEKGEEAKKFQCEYCGKKFRDGATYRTHVRKTHTKDVVYKCSLCELRFTESWDLRRHRKYVHNIFYRYRKKKKVNVASDA